MRHPFRLIGAVLLACAVVRGPARRRQRTVAPPAGSSTRWLDLTRAAIVTPETMSLQERTAVRVLVEEVEKRTNVRLPVSAEWPAEAVAAIAVGPIATSSGWAGAALRGPARRARRPAPRATGSSSMPPAAAPPQSSCSGADARGVLFGVGRLLRELRMARGAVRAPATLAIVSTPQVALRGHQLGYRPKTNAYDAWDVPMWEQYIRDLAIFGTNAIELMPPRTDDDADSPHFPLPQMDMMVADVAHRGRVRAGRVGLVSRHGPGLRRSPNRWIPRSRNGPTCCRSCRA